MNILINTRKIQVGILPDVVKEAFYSLLKKALNISIMLILCNWGHNIYAQTRQRININDGWRFMRYVGEPDRLIYDNRPVVTGRRERIADDKPIATEVAKSTDDVLKKWILPTANDFIADSTKRYERPAGNPGSDFPFVQSDFDDKQWQMIDLPHDWAIKGPFYTEANPVVGGGMGRLPVQGVAWYRKKLNIPATDKGKSLYLDIDGAMSYAMVWINGKIVGGWPYGYSSFRIDLTPYINYGGINQVAIRLDNPINSSRWYPGSGIYRNVWLTKVSPVHIAHWGSFVRTTDISAASAKVNLDINIENKSASTSIIKAITEIYTLNNQSQKVKKVAEFPTKNLQIPAGDKKELEASATLLKPRLWGPMPFQKPNLYVAVTHLYQNGKQIDEYETRFGVKSIAYDPLKGVLVNGKPVRLQGVNQHHDLGALGSAFNLRATERQLELLKEMGCNAIRLAHNPPTPELLELTDKMGFMVIDELYDCWERGKNTLDFHLIYSDWHEPDLRALVRRDRNHPSIIMWSVGNEVGEQYTAEAGAKIAKELVEIAKSEDNTRPVMASMNYAKQDMPFPKEFDVIALNYQGEGIRDAPAYSRLGGIKTPPLYRAFHQQFPDKMIISSESASALSSRGTYIFPVFDGISAPVGEQTGEDSKNKYVSAYELYSAAFGSSPDKVFLTQDQNSYVAGEFVWSGWDYLGEPTPYNARSSYSGIIDLAGFKKDRFYLYQARWRPNYPMAHILPHWTWPARVGLVTPVHVFTSGDEAELFLNGKSLGRKKKGQFEYRIRWDSVRYQPGELKVVSYRHGKLWATDVVKTAGKASKLKLVADRSYIKADGKDLSFITVMVLDDNGNIVPEAANLIKFEVTGAGELVAGDNGNAADMTSFSSPERKAFSGLALAIVKTKPGQKGLIKVTAIADGLATGEVIINNK
jgi:beta-galactosidase